MASATWSTSPATRDADGAEFRTKILIPPSIRCCDLACEDSPDPPSPDVPPGLSSQGHRRRRFPGAAQIYISAYSESYAEFMRTIHVWRALPYTPILMELPDTTRIKGCRVLVVSSWVVTAMDNQSQTLARGVGNLKCTFEAQREIGAPNKVEPGGRFRSGNTHGCGFEEVTTHGVIPAIVEGAECPMEALVNGGSKAGA
ncbi:hypothetical protein DFH09DRAFT_1088820 [Mycena vulgaris]|nr:hypothetical protein DFH09DRAFT_1088820 [Mycena vulgaris]